MHPSQLMQVIGFIQFTNYMLYNVQCTVQTIQDLDLLRKKISVSLEVNFVEKLGAECMRRQVWWQQTVFVERRGYTFPTCL